MKSIPGQWIPLEEVPAEFLAKGLPKTGDTIRIDYDDASRPTSGTAKRVGSQSESAKDYARSPEYGIDFLFTGAIF